MATYLQLCQQVHRILRVGDDAPGTAPTTVVAQALELGDIVYFVNEAWQQLQMHHPDWLWMISSVSVTLTPNVGTVTVSNFRTQNDRFAHIRPYVAQSLQRYGNVRDNSATANPHMPVWFIPWQDYDGWYNRSPTPASARPTFFTEQPNRTVRLYPPPSTPTVGFNWVFSIPCRITPQTLSVDADEPEMPDEFHDILVWWAVDLFCRVRTNMGPLSIEAKREVNRQLDRLAADQLPEMTAWNRYG